MSQISDLTTFAGRLLWARQRNDLTQVQLAERSGVNKDTLSAWETDTSRGEVAREANVRAVAAALRVKPEWLRGGGPTPDIPSVETQSDGRRRSGNAYNSGATKALREVLGLISKYRREMGNDVADGRPPQTDRILSWFAEMEEKATITPPGAGADGGPLPPERQAGRGGR